MPTTFLRGVATAASVLLLSACGLIGGDDLGPQSATPGAPVEKSGVTIAVLPSVEVAPLQLAIREGYCREAGLTDVKVQIVTSGQDSTIGVINDTYQFVYASYVPLITAHVSGVAEMRLVTDNSYAAPLSAVLVTTRVPDPKALEGQIIAVPATGTMADLMVKEVLRSKGVDPAKVRFVGMPFPDMGAALQRGDIAAAMLVDPFATRAQKEVGATVLLDLGIGAMEGIPYTGYATTKKFADENPRTVEAFQRCMLRGSEKAGDRAALESVVVKPVIPDLKPVDPYTASLMNPAAFRATLRPDDTRIQRIVDLMKANDMLKKDEPFQATSIIIKTPDVK